MKKLFSLLLVTMLVFTCFSFSGSAAEGGSLVVSGSETVVNGEIDICVEYTGNPGIAGMNFKLNYDNTKFVPKSYEKGTLFGGNPLSNLDSVSDGDYSKFKYATYMWSGTSNVKANGTVLKVTFKAVNTDWHEAIFEVSYESGDISDQNFNDISPEITAYEILQTYEVKFDANGGDSAPEALIKSYGQDLIIPEFTPYKKGHDFLGWATSKTATEAEYVSGQAYDKDADCALYAVWEARKVKAIFDTGCAITCEPKVVTFDKAYGTLPTIARAGYNFLGWYSDSECIQNTTVVDNENDHTLTAKWEKIRYDINYYLDTQKLTSQVKEYGTPINLISLIPEKSGYTFVGWAKESGSVDVSYMPEELYENNHSMDLYAVMIENSKMPVVTIDNVTARSGEEIDVKVTVSENCGFAGFVLDMEFDNTKITPVAITKGEILTGAIVSNIDQGGDFSELKNLIVQFSNPSDIKANGVLYTIKFMVKENLEEQTVPLKLSYEYGSVANQNFDNVYLRINQGNIEIINVIMGDIYEDMKVNTKDSIMLSQYLANWGIQLSKNQYRAADVYSDGKVNTKDSIKLSQYLAGWDVSLEK